VCVCVCVCEVNQMNTNSHKTTSASMQFTAMQTIQWNLKISRMLMYVCIYEDVRVW